jgi:WD40 repeat protein
MSGNFFSRAAWSPDGKQSAVGGLPDRTLQVWDGGAGKIRFKADPIFDQAHWLPDGTRFVGLAFDPGSARRLSDQTFFDLSIATWDARTGERLSRTPKLPIDHPVWGVAWSADGTKLATCEWTAGAPESPVKLWDVATGKLLRQVAGLPDGEAGRAMSFSPDGKRLALGGWLGGQVRVWQVDSGRTLHTFTGTAFIIHSVAWSPDGAVVLAADSDGQVRRWDAETGRPGHRLLQLSGDRYLLVSPDGHYDGSPQIERQLVVVVLTDDGRQETLTPAEFEQKYGWHNDPEKARLLPE